MKPTLLLPQFDADLTQIIWVALPVEFIEGLLERDGVFCQALLGKIYVN